MWETENSLVSLQLRVGWAVGMERLMGHLIEPLELPYKIDTVVIFVHIIDEENEIREAG